MDNTKKHITFTQIIIILSICLGISTGSLSLFFLDENEIMAFIPIFITALFIIPRIILIFFHKRPPLDIWAVFTYTSILIFVYSPWYHLITKQPIANNLPYDFTGLLTFVAWTSLPIIPLFFLGGFLRRICKRKVVFSIYYLKELPNIIPIGITYILIGLGANIIIKLGVSFGVLTGTLYVLKDFFSVGLIIWYYNWANKNSNQGKHLKVLGILYLIVIVALISLFNLDRGSRFFILIYSFWGLYIYISKFNKKINIIKIFIVALLIVVPLLTQYKLYKYSNYDVDYILDRDYRSSIEEEYEQLTPSYTIATDLGRYYIWMLYYKELHQNGNIDFQYGKTFVDGILTMFPSWIVPNKPPGMIALSHDAESGRGFYEQYKPSTAKIGGFWAEGYVNFGLIGVWVLAIIYGFLIEVFNEAITGRFFGRITPIISGLLVTFGAEFLLHDSRLILWHLSKDFVLVLPLIIYIKFRNERFNQ
ncbi:UNVERIFIED_ORG: hypothetical protein ABIC97_003030 [Peribacillus simplex]